MEMNMELLEAYYQQYKTNDQRNNLISPQDKKNYRIRILSFTCISGKGGDNIP